MVDSLNLRVKKKLNLRDGGEKEALHFDVDRPRILHSCFLIHFSIETKRCYLHLNLLAFADRKTSEFCLYVLHGYPVIY